MFGYYCNNKWFTMVTFLGILFALICQNACCSPPSIVTDLDKTFGGPLEDEIHSIQLTSDGGYILTGSTKSNEGNSHDLLLAKTDQNGNIIWQKTYGGPKDDEGYSAELATDGYIVTGRTRSYGSGMYDAWLLKIDPAGEKIWDKTFGGTSNDEGYSVEQTTDGGYIFTGETRSYGSGMSDVWVIKTDQYGNKVWDKTFGGALDDMGDSIQQIRDGGYVIAGTTSSNGSGQADAWLIRTDQDGNTIWEKTFGGPQSELNPWSKGWSVRETIDGEYILVGSTNSYGSGGYDIWFVKTDPNGHLIADKTYGGRLDEEAGSLIQTNDGEYILVGSTSSGGKGGYDAWLIKVGRDGEKIWDQTFGGELDDKGYSIQQTDDDGYVFAGKTKSNIAFVPETTGCCDTNRPGISSNFDAWLVKSRSGSPRINVQPAGSTTCEGQEVKFTVSANGTEPFLYQWKKDGSEIIGGNTDTYIITGVNAKDAGSYSVTVSNPDGLIQSDLAVLEVGSKPSIDVQPSPQNVSEQSVIVFSVQASGSEPLRYQWKKNGENISGANADTYSISGVSESATGNYSAVVSNTCGFVQSDQAELTVNLKPLVKTTPIYETVCEGSEIALSVEATGTGPLVYQWMKDGESITGANANSYYLRSVRTDDAGTYSVAVGNCCGLVESKIAELKVRAKPSILVQPASRTECEGNEVAFNVQVASTEPFTYQWRKNGENITGASENIYRIPAVGAADAGDYSVIISSQFCGWIESEPASLIVISRPVVVDQPVGQSACEGASISFRANVTGSEPLNYQWMKGGAEIPGANLGSYYIANATAGDSGSYSLIISNCCGFAVSSVADLVVDAGPSIAVQPAGQTVCEGSPVTFSVQAKRQRAIGLSMDERRN